MTLPGPVATPVVFDVNVLVQAMSRKGHSKPACTWPHPACPVKRQAKGERRSLAEADYAALLDAAHQYLKAPIVLVWVNLNVHTSAEMRRLIAGMGRLHVVRLPAYAADLNPTEGVWSHAERSMGNLAAHGVDHLAAVVRNRLKRIQYRPELINGFLAQTGPSPWPLRS